MTAKILSLQDHKDRKEKEQYRSILHSILENIKHLTGGRNIMDRTVYVEKTDGSTSLLVLAAAVALTACGFNPLEGDFGVVEVVPVRDSCKVRVRIHDSLGVQRSVYWEKRPCDGEGHRLEVFGRPVGR